MKSTSQHKKIVPPLHEQARAYIRDLPDGGLITDLLQLVRHRFPDLSTDDVIALTLWEYFDERYPGITRSFLVRMFDEEIRVLHDVDVNDPSTRAETRKLREASA